MKRKLLAALLALMFVICAISFPAAAETTPPTGISAPVQSTLSFSNDTLTQNMEKLDSYRRRIKTLTTDARTVTGDKSEPYKDFLSVKEFAYIRNPVARYTKLEFPGTDSNKDELSIGYHEEIIIGEKCWSRMTPNEKWTAWDSYVSEKPVTQKYSCHLCIKFSAVVSQLH